ncbi:SigB/SigF/SigG family RNA polymerase sigma factor [Streptomyces bacillaris]|uniref:SigB/SigF/SigG family RNA polymerase sigma factor n=3 Tax=Streptomyces TaxID=1883 RepID=A0AAD0Q0N7_9ACTN|nr:MULTISPECIES: SigB/SigF/SigG family RNA polymerase sigma factor [Streptomyces]NUW20605.1 SigB/SigF/SigG family RNA polymerase sigma factor [Streptomyces roseoviolaceus]ATY94263.1 B/F/G family RNA polymerase sigma-70 factor [Streptomyces cavourensis]AXI70091.1 SigB/SigF/SigG family RNA polymerase sigma factor [Streptomyces cavourensis]MBH0243704.1 SigB/SigF/SigG family RNA polymerase sigma factor [Streptomyces cavourensis]NUV40715.1 SigB/SigF/SigG family RNA polymerase sigma factor [Streptom
MTTTSSRLRPSAALGHGATATATPTALPRVEDPAKIAPKDARALGSLFFEQLQVLEEGTQEYQYARNTLIEMNLSLVHFAAKRFRNRGSGEMEDIVQVGTIGLIKAIDRFELSREVEFTSFAIPYIVGEIKRFFRDSTWAVHVPRRLQELRVSLAKAKESLTSVLGRDPGVAELAEHLNMSEEEVIEGLIAANGYTAGSLDLPIGAEQNSSETVTYGDIKGDVDPAMELVEDLHALAPLLDRLDDRDRELVAMRFGQEMTQAQIGEHLGISQMHVSRLLTRLLTKLRKEMLTQN